jgi:4a-hydroxytetrahydrobiopterin dehydratase
MAGGFFTMAGRLSRRLAAFTMAGGFHEAAYLHRDPTRAATTPGGMEASSGGLTIQMTVLTDQEVEERLADGEWGRDGKVIVRDRTFADFNGAIAFVNRVAELAEAANHHPDILVHGWNKVRLELSTHSEGALTEADLELAARIDLLA